MSRRLAPLCGLSCLLLCLGAPALASDDAVRARDDRIAELERKLDVVVGELARVRTQVAVPEDTTLEGFGAAGPAGGSPVGARGLSIGGYGEGFYTNFVNDEGDALDSADLLRLVLYVGYRFNENISFHSEIEIEHADEIFVEQAALDFEWQEWANFRAGLVLMPVGFVNEIHEPPYFFGVQRPVTERTIIPSTWRENGVGLFGRIGESLAYRTYVVNGFAASDFSDAGIRGGRQKGSQTLAEDLAWVGRLDWTPSDEWLLGGSLYVGKAGQDEKVDGMTLPGSRLTLGELHAQFRRGPFHARALFAMSHLANAGKLSTALGKTASDAIAERMFGGYAEVAYDVWPLLFQEASQYLAPFVRVEYVDTQARVPSGFSEDRSKATWVYTPGLQYKPHPSVVLKAEYRNFQQRAADAADEVSLGFGYAF